jgi:tRNA (cytidine/uridine-2'-O-)-methyltransferase
MRMKAPKLVFYHPEIPHNVGALLRLSAAWNIPLHVIGPFPFLWSEPHIKRLSAGNAVHASYTSYESWTEYQSTCTGKEKHVLLDTHGSVSYTEHTFTPHDCFVVGSESCGVSKDVAHAMHSTVHIPMSSKVRSLNVSMAAAMVLSLAYARLPWSLG